LLMTWAIAFIMDTFQNVWSGKLFDSWCGLPFVTLILPWQFWRRTLRQLPRNYMPNLSLLGCYP
jgi:hypothetical protein